jgi:hypothetical protein
MREPRPMNVRDAILCDIEETLAIIAHKEDLLRTRPSRSHRFALDGYRLQLDRLRAELSEFDQAHSVPAPIVDSSLAAPVEGRAGT